MSVNKQEPLFITELFNKVISPDDSELISGYDFATSRKVREELSQLENMLLIDGLDHAIMRLNYYVDDDFSQGSGYIDPRGKMSLEYETLWMNKYRDNVDSLSTEISTIYRWRLMNRTNALSFTDNKEKIFKILQKQYKETDLLQKNTLSNILLQFSQEGAKLGNNLKNEDHNHNTLDNDAIRPLQDNNSLLCYPNSVWGEFFHRANILLKHLSSMQESSENNTVNQYYYNEYMKLFTAYLDHIHYDYMDDDTFSKLILRQMVWDVSTLIVFTLTKNHPYLFTTNKNYYSSYIVNASNDLDEINKRIAIVQKEYNSNKYITILSPINPQINYNKVLFPMLRRDYFKDLLKYAQNDVTHINYLINLFFYKSSSYKMGLFHMDENYLTLYFELLLQYVNEQYENNYEKWVDHIDQYSKACDTGEGTIYYNLFPLKKNSVFNDDFRFSELIAAIVYTYVSNENEAYELCYEFGQLTQSNTNELTHLVLKYFPQEVLINKESDEYLKYVPDNVVDNGLYQSYLSSCTLEERVKIVNGDFRLLLSYYNQSYQELVTKYFITHRHTLKEEIFSWVIEAIVTESVEIAINKLKKSQVERKFKYMCNTENA